LPPRVRPKSHSRGADFPMFRGYLVLFAIQTSGAVILFWYSVPLFRQALLDPGSHVPRTENLVWSLSAIMLMQAGFWIRHRLRPPLPQLRNALLGYIVLFVARTTYPRLVLRSRYWLVRLVLLHAGTRAIWKSIDRAPTPQIEMSHVRTFLGSK
jgi:hypothetical protein